MMMPKKTTVDFFFVEEDGKVGVECEACGKRFFDRMSAGKRPRLLESAFPVAIDHANKEHQSTGGQMTKRPKANGKTHEA